MLFIITKSGSSDGYGEPIAVARNKEEVENYIKSHANACFIKHGCNFDKITLSGKTEQPYGWRKEAYMVNASALDSNDARVTETRFEVFQASDAVDLESLNFFGE